MTATSSTDWARDAAISLFNSKAWVDADNNSIRGLADHIPLLEAVLLSTAKKAREDAITEAAKKCQGPDEGYLHGCPCRSRVYALASKEEG